MRPDHARALAALEDQARRRGLSPATIATRRHALTKLLAALDCPLGRATADDVRRALASRPRGRRADDLSALRALFRLALEGAPHRALPTDRLRAPRTRPAPPLLLDEAAVARLLAAAHDAARACAERSARRVDARPSPTASRAELAPGHGRAPAPPWPSPSPPALDLAVSLSLARAQRDVVAVELLYATGLRASELRAARCADLDLARGTLGVRPTKRGTPRELPLPPPVVRALATYLREGRPRLAARAARDPGHLLLSHAGSPLSQHQPWRLLARLARAVGLRARPHALRRAIATHLARAGAALPVVQHLLGHASLAATARYVAVDRADLHRAVAALDDVAASAGLPPEPGRAAPPARPGAPRATPPR